MFFFLRGKDRFFFTKSESLVRPVWKEIVIIELPVDIRHDTACFHN